MEEVKKCPVCGSERVHPVAVYIRTCDKLHTFTSEGYDVRLNAHTHPAPDPRGVIVSREFLGECCHRWLEVEQFHKGSVLMERVELVSYVGPTGTIWRD